MGLGVSQIHKKATRAASEAAPHAKNAAVNGSCANGHTINAKKGGRMKAEEVAAHPTARSWTAMAASAEYRSGVPISLAPA
jgi:hypothetical protein